jgi:hypothetical protein
LRWDLGAVVPWHLLNLKFSKNETSAALSSTPLAAAPPPQPQAGMILSADGGGGCSGAFKAMLPVKK